jgi:uncharacterized protein YaiE (UPF0345 family)
MGEEPTGSDVAQRMDMQIEESGNGFTVAIEEKKQVYFTESRWNSEENATRTLEQQYARTAEQLNGSADVTVESHSFESSTTEEPATVTVEYTVELENVRDEMNKELVNGLTEDPTMNVSEEDSAAIEESLDDLEITKVEMSYVQGMRGNMSGSATVVLSNYQDPVVTYMNATAEEDGVITDEQVTETRETFEAQSEADLQQELTWNATVEPAEEDGMTVVKATAAYETENWDAYLEERHGDDFSNQTEATFDVNVTSTGEEVDADMTFQVNRDDFMDNAVDKGLTELRNDSSELDEDEMQFLKAFDESDVHVAKTDVVFGNETVEVRAAGQFENLSAFQQTQDLPASSSVTHVYGETENQTEMTYVYVEDENITAETVQDTVFADENSTVHAQGEWDREFPKMNTSQTANYLDVQPEEDSGTDIPVIPAAVLLLLVVVGGGAAYWYRG